MTTRAPTIEEARAQEVIAHMQRAVQEKLARLRYMIEVATRYPTPRGTVKSACLITTALYPCNRQPVHRLFLLCGVDWSTVRKVAA